MNLRDLAEVAGDGMGPPDPPELLPLPPGSYRGIQYGDGGWGPHQLVNIPADGRGELVLPDGTIIYPDDHWQFPGVTVTPEGLWIWPDGVYFNQNNGEYYYPEDHPQYPGQTVEYFDYGPPPSGPPRSITWPDNPDGSPGVKVVYDKDGNVRYYMPDGEGGERIFPDGTQDVRVIPDLGAPYWDPVVPKPPDTG